MIGGFSISPGFAKALVPSAIGGAAWEAVGLPLGWLMGAAIITGIFAVIGTDVVVPKPLYALSLATLGASVGLSITPDVALALLAWAPVMVIAAALGVAGAVAATPLLARSGRMEHSTAFFSLLPGGVVEMANVGERFGADRTITAALHAMRVALVVGLLPLALFAFADGPGLVIDNAALLPMPFLFATIVLGLAGGWVGSRVGLPAAWLLGALMLVGFTSSFGVLAGRMPEPLLAVVQVVVGMSLGARFQRARLTDIPRALAVGLPVILLIMSAMAAAAFFASFAIPVSVSTLVLCFSIGGMAEMVLTSKSLGQNVALVAAFQAVRGILVNASAALVWRRLAKLPTFSDNPKG